MTQVSGTPGHAARKVRTSGTTWVTSPSADSRSRQMEAGAGGTRIAMLRRMTGYDAAEGLTPVRDDSGFGANLFDQTRVRQVEPSWFSPAWWEGRARPVASGGRGGAWFVDADFGPAVLRRYLRGGLVAQFNHDRYFWHGATRTRSFAEFRLTRERPVTLATALFANP